MKTVNKTITLIAAASVMLATCKKETPETPVNPANPTTGGDSYSSLADFYSQNGVQTQTFSVNASVGGSFTSSKGSIVTIPANCFMDNIGNPVMGQVNIEFKDIYKKSDMLLSNMPPMLQNGYPLKSGGEFFIRAKSGNNAVLLNWSSPITVEQPLNGWALDLGMVAFGLSPADTLGWMQDSSFVNPNNTSTGYIYSMYNFNSPADSGSWGNSDNSSYFSAYQMVLLTLHASNNPTAFPPDVFLLFNNINSMVHVYHGSGNDFPYQYAPDGLQCTMVAVGVDSNGKLFSSFVPITISGSQTVNFTLSETTADNFKLQLNALN